MILNTKEFKECCQTILFAIDTKESSLFTETLELVSEGNTLKLNVTNREYMATVKFQLENEEKFRAAVNAKTFLSLVSKITTNTIELSVSGNTLKVKANGTYTLPMIYNNDKLLELPKINLGEITNEMSIDSSILLSILSHNSKELLRGIGTKPVQKYYYVDEHGAITYTQGACINYFELEKPIKLLLSDKVVKLFKLFKNGDSISFSLGHSQITEDTIQSTVLFKNNRVELIARLSDSGLITSVPVDTLRGMANMTYPHTMIFDKALLLQAINRIMLFNEDSVDYGNVVASGNQLTISDFNNGSTESILATGESSNISEYKMILDLHNLKLVLDGCDDEYITLCFGISKAVVIKKQNVYDIVPELKIKG